jgi:hypothetical protein
MGANITGLISMKGGSLAVYCEDKIPLLSGADKTTWKLDNNISFSSGAKLRTVQELSGAVLALDEGGLSSLQATLNYGSFEVSSFSRLVKPLIDQLLNLVVSSRVVRSKNQYRLYTRSGDVLTCTVMTPNPLIQPQDVSFTRAKYAHGVTCTGWGQLNNEDAYFFGTTDGYVMREDVGASFDGGDVQAVMSLPFSSFKAPSNKKRFRKLILEIDAPQTTEINFRQRFDYADGTYGSSQTQIAEAIAGGGIWGDAEWGAFRWGMPTKTNAEANVSGVGRNMSMLIWHTSALDNAFALQGLLIHYSMLGLSR